MAKFEWDEDAEKKFCELFDTLDTDGSGYITFTELQEAGMKQGVGVLGQNATEEEINQFLKIVDADGDGTVSKDEFRNFLQEFIKQLHEQMNQKPQKNTNTVEWDDAKEEEFNTVFAELDEDGSGTLVFDEVKSYLLKKGAQLLGKNPTDAEVYDFMCKMDKDGNGAVSKDEFRCYIQEFLAKLQDPDALLTEAVDTMMKVIDKDGNGLCSKEEFKAFVQEKGETPLKDEEVDELFSAVDTDGDKTTLTRDELLTVLKIGLHVQQKKAQQS